MIVSILVFGYFLVPRMDLGVRVVIIKSKREVWEGETVFLIRRVSSHEGLYKTPISESALRAYDHSPSSCDLVSILSSNKLRLKIRRCPVDAALSYRADLTGEAMARFVISL